MKPRYILAPQAARGLVQIWRYIKNESSEETTDRVEFIIRDTFAYLAQFPNGGRRRRDMTDADVRFFSVFFYIIVYRPETRPLQICCYTTRSARCGGGHRLSRRQGSSAIISRVQRFQRHSTVRLILSSRAAAF